MIPSHPVAGVGVENEDREWGTAQRDHGQIKHRPVSLLRLPPSSRSGGRHATLVSSVTHGQSWEWIAGHDAQSRLRREAEPFHFHATQLLVRSGPDLAFGQKQGSLSEQDQHTEAIQDYIQHDPSPWRFRP